MFQNGLQMNHYANKSKHKRRLKKIRQAQTALFGICDDPYEKYWSSIYDSFEYCRRIMRKAYHKRIRQILERHIRNTVFDDDYDLSFSNKEFN